MKPAFATGQPVYTPLGRRGLVNHVFRSEKVVRYKVWFERDYVEIMNPKDFQPRRFAFANEVIFPEWMLERARPDS